MPGFKLTEEKFTNNKLYIQVCNLHYIVNLIVVGINF